jgi:hypothetical protein
MLRLTVIRPLSCCQLQVCWCEASSSMRGGVWGLQLLLGLASAFNLGSSTTGLTTIFYWHRHHRKRHVAAPKFNVLLPSSRRLLFLRCSVSCPMSHWVILKAVGVNSLLANSSLFSYGTCFWHLIILISNTFMYWGQHFSQFCEVFWRCLVFLPHQHGTRR